MEEIISKVGLEDMRHHWEQRWEYSPQGTEGPKAIQKAKKHWQLKYLSWKECIVAV